MEADDKLVDAAPESEPQKPTIDELTEAPPTESMPENQLQQAINRVLGEGLDKVVKQAFQIAIQKALEPIVTQAIEKALGSVTVEVPVLAAVTPRRFSSICPDNANRRGGDGSPCNRPMTT
ncbi:hypothetical protein [Thiothrix unzii]|uniref:Uncharacterized protein n=1 Tax=Thiothrix unzii TaxID=111769 RepID=A0A975F9D6_9GAMM|nr:hypothetical protein [Thiothrix unzii]QTR53682.1 hypothetical protein J9260_00910 [Thiothrix unzii]